jgi:hypothetical protein
MSEKKGKGKAAAKSTGAKVKTTAPKGDACHIRTRKMVNNKLLSRKQMVRYAARCDSVENCSFSLSFRSLMWPTLAAVRCPRPSCKPR